jgi:hypothetical protein
VLLVAALPDAAELQVVVTRVAVAQVAAPRRLPTGAVILAPRMARAQRAAAPHKAHAQLRALVGSEALVLVDSEVLVLDVPVTRSLQPILSRVVAQ